MTQLKQFMAVVTGYDLIPQVKKTRTRLIILIVIFLLGFFIIQSATINAITNQIIFAKIKEVSVEYELLSEVFDKEESRLMGFYTFATFMLWVIMSIFSWILLNIILRPISESIKEREQFIHNARHELRTPLTIIQSELELFDTSKLDNNSKLDLLGIKYQVSSMIDLSQNLLTTLSSKNSILKKDNVILNDLIINIDSKIKNIYSNKNIELDCKIQGLTINTNLSLFTQLITNVIENIYKHGLDSSVYTVSDMSPNSIIFENDISNNLINTAHQGVGIIASKAISNKLDYTIESKPSGEGKFKTKISFND